MNFIMSINVTLKKVNELAKKGEYASAFEICNQELAVDSKNYDILRARASILILTDELEKAVEDLLLLASESGEPSDYYDLARAQINNHDYSSAITALDKLLEISKREDFDYYDSSAHFFRAFALIETGQKRAALDDMELLESGMQFWISGKGLITVAQLQNRVK